MAADKKKTRGGADEDEALFRRAAGKVRRLQSDRVHHARKRPRPGPRTDPGAAGSGKDTISGPEAISETAGALHYAAPGVQNRVVRRLKRGQISVEDEIDLHGMRVTEAGDRLAGFLSDCARRELRCVRIIHGKGLRAGGSVLKENVVRWLRSRSDVLAYCSAHPRDGGTGAVNVLLKKSNA